MQVTQVIIRNDARVPAAALEATLSEAAHMAVCPSRACVHRMRACMHMSICLSVVCLSVCLSIYLSIYLYM